MSRHPRARRTRHPTTRCHSRSPTPTSLTTYARNSRRRAPPMTDQPDQQPDARGPADQEPDVQLAHLGHLGEDGGDHPGLRTALEAILMVVDEPVGDVLLAQVTERPTDEVREALHALASEYDEAGRGFELREVAGGWRFYTRASCAAYVERFVLDGQQARLTQAALETLAVVAYRQP